MAFTSIKNQEGNYEIFNDGQRIATGSESVLQNYGLSPTNLTSSANIPQDSITSDVLSGGSSPTITTPTNPPLTTPDSVDFTPIEATPQETELSTLIKGITETNLTLPAEKATFQAEEEKRLGLEQLKVSETDLFSQLKQQEAEFKNLETEDTRIQQRLQEESFARGRTAAGLAPLEAGELRKNFLRKSEKAAEINVTAALLAGTQNKLLTAQTLLERAVANKYGGKEAELKAKIENLSLLLQDPLLSIAQTNRANKQLAIQKKKEEDLAKKKTDSKTILDWAVDARKNGATALEAQSIAKIGLSDIPDLQKAFEIYNKFQKIEAVDLSATAGSLEEFKLVYGRTPNNLAELNQFTASRGEAGRAPEDTETPKDTETKLTSEDRRFLIGFNLSDAMISNIEEGVRTIGIDEVLKDDYTDAQKAAIKKVYGVESKEVTQAQLLQAAQAMKQSDVENFFTARYTEDEINKFAKDAGFAGFFKARATERANYLASPKAREKLAELLAEQYKQQGYIIK